MRLSVISASGIMSVIIMVTVFGESVTNLTEFIANPPVVRELVCCRMSPDGKIPPEYFVVRWQTSAFYIKFSTEPDGVLSNRTFQGYERAAGRYEDSYWCFSGARYAGRNTFQTGSFDQATEDLLGAVHNHMQPAKMVLNMGIGLHEIGDIDWRWDEFEQLLSNCQIRQKGRAFRGKGGRVERIELLNLSQEKARWLTNRIRFSYSYEGSEATDGLPTTITATRFAHDGRIIPLDKWRILKASVGGPVQGPDYFNPFLAADVLTILCSNKNQYAVATGGALRPVLDSGDPRVRKRDRELEMSHPVYYILGASTLVGAAGLLVLAYWRRKSG